MRLFKCHAVMRLLAHENTHVVRTYTVAADSWEKARAHVQDEEPGAEFVTIPVETATVLAEFTLMSVREVADLRAACNWREKQPSITASAVSHVDPRDVGSKR